LRESFKEVHRITISLDSSRIKLMLNLSYLNIFQLYISNPLKTLIYYLHKLRGISQNHDITRVYFLNLFFRLLDKSLIHILLCRTFFDNCFTNY